MKVKFGVKPNLTILKIFVPENGTGTPTPEETKNLPTAKNVSPRIIFSLK